MFKIWHLNDSLHTGFVSQLDVRYDANPSTTHFRFSKKISPKRRIRGKPDDEKREILHIWGATEERPDLVLFSYSHILLQDQIKIKLSESKVVIF